MSKVSRPVILIVEDQAIIASAMKFALENGGFSVLGPFTESKAALAKVALTKPDAAILDYSLKAGSTSRPIAEWLTEKQVPFLVVTGGGVMEHETEEFFLNAPVVQKPFHMAELTDRILQILPSEKRRLLRDDAKA